MFPLCWKHIWSTRATENLETIETGFMNEDEQNTQARSLYNSSVQVKKKRITRKNGATTLSSNLCVVQLDWDVAGTEFPRT